MSKQRFIKEYLDSSIQIGDFVSVKGLGISDKEKQGSSVYVTDIKDGGVHYKHEGRTQICPIEFVVKNPLFIGNNPFVIKPWHSGITFSNYNLQSVLSKIGFDAYSCEFVQERLTHGIQVAGVDWNPTINGVLYQRGYVWSETQGRLLIESIYQGINIGTIILKKNSFSDIEKGKKHTWYDLVDGKQRLFAITQFMTDRFVDSYGNLYSELSGFAQIKFRNFNSLSYGEVGESATATDIKNIFLNTNFAGVQMSQEHLDFVKSIEL